MNDTRDLFISLQFVAPACVVVLGLVLAVALRRRLGRAAPLTICAFAALSIVYVGSTIWVRHLEKVYAEPGPVDDAVVLMSDRLNWASAAVSAVGFALLIAALVTKPDRRPAAVVEPPPERADAP